MGHSFSGRTGIGHCYIGGLSKGSRHPEGGTFILNKRFAGYCNAPNLGCAGFFQGAGGLFHG